MAEEFVELGAEAVNHITENHWDAIHDNTVKVIHRGKHGKSSSGRDGNRDRDRDRESNVDRHRERKYRAELPSPERERVRDDSLERQSETSARVTQQYRNERDDPIRPVDPALEKRRRRDSARMSYANGYGQQDRAHSAAPPRSRYYDDDGDSDYDEREGRRYKSGGARGYEDDRGYDREVIETERYRGVSDEHSRHCDELFVLTHLVHSHLVPTTPAATTPTPPAATPTPTAPEP